MMAATMDGEVGRNAKDQQILAQSEADEGVPNFV